MPNGGRPFPTDDSKNIPNEALYFFLRGSKFLRSRFWTFFSHENAPARSDTHCLAMDFCGPDYWAAFEARFWTEFVFQFWINFRLRFFGPNLCLNFGSIFDTVFST